jgi:hypothetical protein
MLKSILFSLVAMVLLSSPALAVLPDCPPNFKLQHQDFAIGSINLVALVGAGGQSNSTNTVMLLNNQSDQKLCSMACQDALVMFVQSGCVIGTCGGAWNVMQDAIVAGDQLQLIGDGCGEKLETQGLVVGLGQQVMKLDGTGTATGDHTLAVIQNQAAGNSAGTMGQSSALLAGQLSSVSGGPCTSGQATTTLTVGTTQTQVDL